MFAFPAIGWWRFNLNPIFAFWFAYIVTRPLGASFADWFSKPTYGPVWVLATAPSSLIEFALFVALVAWVTITARRAAATACTRTRTYAEPAARAALGARAEAESRSCQRGLPPWRRRCRRRTTPPQWTPHRSDERSPRRGADAVALPSPLGDRRFAARPRAILDVRSRSDRGRELCRARDPGAASSSRHVVFCFVLCAPLHRAAGAAVALLRADRPDRARAVADLHAAARRRRGARRAVLAGARRTADRDHRRRGRHRGRRGDGRARWSPTDVAKFWVGITGARRRRAVLGVSIRQRRALIASLQERAARLEFERDQEGRLAAAAERARIAREMHDIVSHNLTVMIGLADGATYALRSAPEAAGSAMQRVSATGRQALGEMRRLLGVLRDEPSRRAVRASARARPARRAPGQGRGRGHPGLDRDRRRSSRALGRRPAGGLPGRPGGADEHAQARRAAGDRPPGAAIAGGRVELR